MFSYDTTVFPTFLLATVSDSDLTKCERVQINRMLHHRTRISLIRHSSESRLEDETRKKISMRKR